MSKRKCCEKEEENEHVEEKMESVSSTNITREDMEEAQPPPLKRRCFGVKCCNHDGDDDDDDGDDGSKISNTCTILNDQKANEQDRKQMEEKFLDCVGIDTYTHDDIVRVSKILEGLIPSRYDYPATTTTTTTTTTDDSKQIGVSPCDTEQQTGTGMTTTTTSIHSSITSTTTNALLSDQKIMIRYDFDFTQQFLENAKQLWERCRTLYGDNNLQTLRVQYQFGKLLFYDYETCFEAVEPILRDCLSRYESHHYHPDKYEEHCLLFNVYYYWLLTWSKMIKWHKDSLPENLLSLFEIMNSTMVLSPTLYCKIYAVVVIIYYETDRIEDVIKVGQKNHNLITNIVKPQNYCLYLEYLSAYGQSLYRLSKNEDALDVMTTFRSSVKKLQSEWRVTEEMRTLACVYMELERYKEALEIFQTVNFKSKEGQLEVRVDMMTCYCQLNDYDMVVTLGDDLLSDMISQQTSDKDDFQVISFAMFHCLSEYVNKCEVDTKTPDPLYIKRLFEYGQKCLEMFDRYEPSAQKNIITLLLCNYLFDKQYKQALELSHHPVLSSEKKEMIQMCHSRVKDDVEKSAQKCCCCESNRTHAFMICGHYCCCESCSKKIIKCPICRLVNDTIPVGYINASQTCLLLPCLHIAIGHNRHDITHCLSCATEIISKIQLYNA